MYALKAGVKQDPHRRWRLPDRIFFGHGACHTLAGVFLKYPPLAGFYAERIIPADGFGGNHVYVTDGMIAFDHHGYTLRLRLLRYHTNGWARRNGEGWTCRLERVGFALLSTPVLNARKMRGPDQYLCDPIPRARRFIQRIDHTSAAIKARRKERGA